MIQNIKKNFIEYFVIFLVRVFASIASLLVTILISRLMDVDQVGLYFISFSFLIILSSIALLGLADSFIRFISSFLAERNWEVVKGIFVTGTVSSLIFSTLILLIVFFLSEKIVYFLKIEERLVDILKITAITIPLYAINQLVGSAFQGKQMFKSSIFFKNISIPLIFACQLVINYFIGYDLNAYIAVSLYFFSCLISVSISMISWFSEPRLKKIKPNYKYSVDLKNSAFPLWISSFMIISLEWLPIILASNYISTNEIALLSISQRVAVLLSFLLIVVNLIAAPKFAASFKLGNYSELKSIALSCNRILILLGTPLFIFMLVFPEIILSIFGEEYKNAKYLLIILVLGQYINVITGSVGFLLMMTGHENDLKNVTIFSLALCLTLTVLLSKIYGVMGTAISIAFAMAIQNLILVYYVKIRLGFNTLNYFKM